MNPIWKRPPAETRQEEYTEFYQHISHNWDEPILQLSFRAEGRWEYAALLFVPAQAPHDLYYHAASFGLQLYSQRMLIADNCQDLLPRYLRFLKGVIDAADLPLHVSRQTLQDVQHLTRIRKWLTRKVVDALCKLRKEDAAKYLLIWREFGRTLKEGISEDQDNREQLIPALLFESSAHETTLTDLESYVSRMKPDQKEIFYLAGESRAVIDQSPHLEEFRARGYEVLCLTEPVDELVTQSMTEFDGRRLRSVAKGEIQFSVDEHLGARVRGVRVSRRLTVSPACLAGEDMDYSPHIERLLNGNRAASSRPRTLELNSNHAIVDNLYKRFERDPGDPVIALAADVLLGLALLGEGSAVPDRVVFAGRVADLLGQSLSGEESGAAFPVCA
jgi:molecular chaperone HtpG